MSEEEPLFTELERGKGTSFDGHPSFKIRKEVQIFLQSLFQGFFSLTGIGPDHVCPNLSFNEIKIKNPPVPHPPGLIEFHLSVRNSH